MREKEEFYEKHWLLNLICLWGRLLLGAAMISETKYITIGFSLPNPINSAISFNYYEQSYQVQQKKNYEFRLLKLDWLSLGCRTQKGKIARNSNRNIGNHGYEVGVWWRVIFSSVYTAQKKCCANHLVKRFKALQHMIQIWQFNN